MIPKIFHMVIHIDPSKPEGRVEGGHHHPEMEKWLRDSGSVKIEHMVQSQNYVPPTATSNGQLHVTTTVFYR